MSWKHVFNTHVGSSLDIAESAKKAAGCGYHFMAFDGVVYFLVDHFCDGKVSFHYAGIRVEELV